jgi:hypothetical protein
MGEAVVLHELLALGSLAYMRGWIISARTEPDSISPKAAPHSSLSYEPAVGAGLGVRMWMRRGRLTSTRPAKDKDHSHSGSVECRGISELGYHSGFTVRLSLSWGRGRGGSGSRRGGIVLVGVTDVEGLLDLVDDCHVDEVGV